MRHIGGTALIFLCGCTTSLMVLRVDPARPETRVGLPYPLPYTRYEIEITRQIAGCGPLLKALVKADIKKVTTAPDPNQIFVLDPNSLSSAFKTSAVKIDYQLNGSLASLNASAEDRSAQIISNVVAIAGGAVEDLETVETATEARVPRDSVQVPDPISVDEILDVHLYLKSFQGTLKDLLHQPDHSR